MWILRSVLGRLVFLFVLLAAPAYAQQYLNLTNNPERKHRIDLNASLPLDLSRVNRHLIINPTLIHNRLLTPTPSGTETVIGQLALGTDFLQAFNKYVNDSSSRYQYLLRPGVVHGSLALVGTHHVDDHIRLWVDGTAGLKLLHYAPTDSLGHTAENWFWQRDFGLGGGVAYNSAESDNASDLFAINVQWVRSAHDLTKATQQTFREQFGQANQAYYTDLSLRFRLWPGKPAYNWQGYGTVSWQKFYADYHHPSVAMIGLSLVPVFRSPQEKIKAREAKKTQKAAEAAQQAAEAAQKAAEAAQTVAAEAQTAEVEAQKVAKAAQTAVAEAKTSAEKDQKAEAAKRAKEAAEKAADEAKKAKEVAEKAVDDAKKAKTAADEAKKASKGE